MVLFLELLNTPPLCDVLLFGFIKYRLPFSLFNFPLNDLFVLFVKNGFISFFFF